jgi:hypothetical protein
MKKRMVVCVAAWMMLLGVNSASAQFIPGISELTVYGGATFDGANSGTVGGALTLNLTSRIGVEGEIGVILATEKIINVNVSFIFNFGSGLSAIAPYLVGGAGALVDGGTDIALNGGGGLKLFVDTHVALRGDFRVFLGSSSGQVEDMERFYGGIEFFF